MNKSTINELHINAIKTKDSIAKALFSTFKGALDNELKNGSIKSEKEIIENLAKKFTENAKIMNTPEALQEIKLLEPLLPNELHIDVYRDIINNLILTEQIELNEKNMGKITGLSISKMKNEYMGYNIDAKIITTILKSYL